MNFPKKINLTFHNVIITILSAITGRELIWYIQYKKLYGDECSFTLHLKNKSGHFNGTYLSHEIDDFVLTLVARWIYVDPIKQLEMYMKYPESYNREAVNFVNNWDYYTHTIRNIYEISN